MNLKKYFRDQVCPTNYLELFNDELFPPNSDSLYAKKEGEFIDKDENRSKLLIFNPAIEDADVEWLRLSQIFLDNYVLFEDKIEHIDIIQGKLGNGYLLTAFASMAEHPELLVEIFKQHQITKNGCYEIAMKINGEWQIVIIDDFIPCDKKTKKPLFAKPHGSEAWVMLLEKAWAKANGGYLNICNGTCIEVLQALTPFIQEQYLPMYYWGEDFIWDKIKSSVKNGYIIGTNTVGNTGVTEVGLLSAHAYTIINVKEGEVNGENIRLLRIRNTAGTQTYTGSWSDNSKDWTNDAITVFKRDSVKDANDGCFWIEFNDYFQRFILLDICLVQKTTCSKSLKPTEETKDKSHVYNLRLESKATVNIQVFKRQYRFKRSIPDSSLLLINLILLKKGNIQNYIPFTFIKSSSELWCNPTISMELEPGDYLIYVHADYTYHTFDKPRKWVLDVSSSSFFDLHYIDIDPNFILLKEIIYYYNYEHSPGISLY